MSWYPPELVTCPGCGSRFSTPIDSYEHRRNCTWKTTRWLNGSYERFDERSSASLLVAPNPFGGKWRWMQQQRIYGAGGNPSSEGIYRRGKKWVPHMTENGWEWIQA